jgi:hypothetical protein
MRTTLMALVAVGMFGFGLTASMAQQQPLPRQDPSTIRVNPPASSQYNPPYMTAPVPTPDTSTSHNPYRQRYMPQPNPRR